MTTWAQVLLGLIQLFGGLVKFLDAKQMLQAGGALVVADALKGQADEIAKAQKARDDVRAAAARDPASILRDNDGFRRD